MGTNVATHKAIERGLGGVPYNNVDAKAKGLWGNFTMCFGEQTFMTSSCTII